MSLKDDILADDDGKWEDVKTPEWKSSPVTRVKALSGTERDAFEASSRQLRPNPKGGFDVVPNQENARARFLVRAIIDPDTGERIFTDQDANALGRKNAAVLDRLFEVGTRLSGMSDDDVAAIEGNSEAVPSDGSTSTSPDESSTAP